MMAAYRQQTMEFGRSDQIIKAGQLKYREPRMITRWRNRYVEFKITAAGRLSFTVYREQPASPANEITQVCIEDYGGLDNTMKLDGEKFAFAIITTGITECFAADSAASLQEWSHVIHEYLGKELVFAISIPYKQNTLKAGRGFIRIRNTAFTITTNETPARCQCSWQILHIRKFGGSDAFRFETGSKCPTGEFMYVLNTEDNDRVRAVFNDLSHHRPIFTDDRMGRRMTQEHAILQRIRSGEKSGTSLHSRVGTRRSLQQDAPRVYENTGRSLKVQQRPSLDDLSRPRSHAVLQDDGYNPSGNKIKHSNSSTDVVTDRYYYNMAETMMPHAGGTARQLPPLPLPQTENYSDISQTPYDYHSYYNRTSSGAIPPLSMPPDQSKLPVSPIRATPDTEDSDDDFVDVQRISANMTTTTTNYYNITETRQQLAIKQQTEVQSYVNIRPSKSKSRSPRSTSPAVPVTIPARQGELDVSGDQPHLYTNVNIGTHRPSSKSPSASPPMESSKPIPSTDSSGSFPVSSRSPSPPVSRTPPLVHVSKPSFNDSPRLAQRNGHCHSLSSSNSCSDSGSDQEFGVFRRRTTSIVENKVVSADYNSRSCDDLTEIAGPILRTLQGSSNSGTLSDSEIIQSKTQALHSGHGKHLTSKLTQHNRADEDRHTSPKLPPKDRRSPYDHLNLIADSRSPISSPEPESNSRPSSRTNYDTLEPRERRLVTSSSDDERDEHTRANSDSSDYQVFTMPQQTRYGDTMNMYKRKLHATGRCHDYEEVDLPDDRPLSSDSSTASPEPSPNYVATEDLRSWQYHRKVVVTGREHAYEQVELSEQSVSTVVEVNKRPVDLHKQSKSSTRSKKVSPETLCSPTRRPLPLQHVAMGYSDDQVGLSTVVEENSVDDKRPSLPRASNSADSMEKLARQKSPFRKNRSLAEMDSRQSPTHYSQREASPGSSVTRSPRTRPTRSSAPSGPPPLPPKPLPVNHQRSRSDEGASNSSAPSLPPRIQHQSSFEKECQRVTPNYTKVYVSVNPVSSGHGTASRVVANEKVRASPYSEINHFATHQLGIMTENRKMEKERTALPRP